MLMADLSDIYGHSFERLVDFMQDIGGAEVEEGRVGAGWSGAGARDSTDTLTSLLNSLAAETGYQVPCSL